MDKDTIFIEQHKQMCGKQKAKEILELAKKNCPDKKAAKSVYLDAYGNEVHVNGPIVVPLVPYETLQQKIARFDALAVNVAANRQLMAELKADFFEDEETEAEEEKAMAEVESVDDFGDTYVVKTQLSMPLNKKEANVEESAGEQPVFAEPQTAQGKNGTAAVKADDEALADDVNDVD